MYYQDPSTFTNSNAGSERLQGEFSINRKKRKKEILLEFKEKQKELEAQERLVNEEAAVKVKKEISANIKGLASQSKAVQGNLMKRTKIVVEELEKEDEIIDAPKPPSQKFPHFLVERVIGEVGEKGAFKIFFSAHNIEELIKNEIIEGNFIL